MRVESFAWADVLRMLTAQLAWFLAILLGAAAVDKLVRWRHTISVAQRFAGAPEANAGAASAAAVGCELAAAVALAFPASRAAGAATAALLWTLYLGLLLRAFRSGRRDVDCGCSVGSQAAGVHRPLGTFHVVRNGALVISALLVAALSVHGAVGVLPSQVLAACAFLALYAAFDQTMLLRPLRSGEAS